MPLSSETAELLAEYEQSLLSDAHFQGETRFDLVTRLLYSTDASIYQIEPLGVVFPKTASDLVAAVETAAKYQLPILARGAGSSLAGQAVGRAVILDCSKYLNRCLEINAEEGWARVEPGLVLAALNRQAGVHKMQFGPDPASAERATLGGCIANNAAGAHSIWYGMTVDHVLEVDVILADGSQARLAPLALAEAEHRAQTGESIESRLYRAALTVRHNSAEMVRSRWPKTWRRSAGYNLNYLLPWSPSRPPHWQQAAQTWARPGVVYSGIYPPLSPGEINLSGLFAGSEGTLAVMRQAKLRLVPLPAATTLVVIAYDSIPAACDDVPDLLRLEPSAVELIPRKLVELARSVPAYASQLAFVDDLIVGGEIPAALLAVEFAGNDRDYLHAQAGKLLQGGEVRKSAFWARTPEMQKQVWAVRKVGLGILMSRPGSQKPIAFIEDMGIPVENLGTFVREMDLILDKYDVQAEIYAHASAGCLHIRPLIDLKTGQGRKYLRAIATEAVALTLRLGGSTSAEHGDGLARSEWLEQTYGTEIIAAFRQIKEAADPHYLLNPGKIIAPPPMDQNLRYGHVYNSQAWTPVLDFYQKGAQGLVDAVEQCNGAGVCRKSDGVMCPSFQASQDEMHSTRGRANLLRAMISGSFASQQLAKGAAKEALDLCLACKGCKAECPSGVDMAKLKYEFLDHYYQPGNHRHPLRDYLFAYIDIFARLGIRFARPVNWVMQAAPVKALLDKWLGLSRERSFPRLAVQSLKTRYSHESRRSPLKRPPSIEKVLFLQDAFGEFFHTGASLSALRLLEQAGIFVEFLPGYGAGRTLISKGFLKPAKKRASQLVEAIKRLDQQHSCAVIGLEPSEIYTLRDEYPDLLPGNSSVEELAKRVWTVEEYLIRPGSDGLPRIKRLLKEPANDFPAVVLHGHCYQKTQPPAADGAAVGVNASASVLRAAGISVRVIDSGCCGMAGAFGYETEHFDFSKRVAELALLPAIRLAVQADNHVLVAASGVSCQAQINDLAGSPVYHPLQLLELCLKG